MITWSSYFRKKIDDSDHYHTKQTKIKNLSQLAKLVQTGKLEVPLGLTNYVTDHTSLIDQIFTILTGDDIEGMLPDILKVSGIDNYVTVVSWTFMYL